VPVEMPQADMREYCIPFKTKTLRM
jgi:hypothetical protein